MNPNPDKPLLAVVLLCLFVWRIQRPIAWLVFALERRGILTSRVQFDARETAQVPALLPRHTPLVVGLPFVRRMKGGR